MNNSKGKKVLQILVGAILISGFVLISLKLYQEMTDGGANDLEPRETLPEDDHMADIGAIRSFMGDERYSATFINSGPATDFRVGRAVSSAKGTSIEGETPAEWIRIVNRYQSAQTIGANCGVYIFEVYPKTHELVNVHIDPQSQIDCETSPASDVDGINTPEVSEGQIKKNGNEFLSRIQTRHYPSIKNDFKINIVGNDGGSLTYEWFWQDPSYKMPEGLGAIPQYPTVRFYIASGGVLIYYQNTIPLFAENGVMPYRATLIGTYTSCLPKHDNFSTEECVIGIKTDDGLYYALDFNLMSASKPRLASGDRFTATGVLTSKGMISSDQTRHTIGEGIFSVTDSVRKL